MNDQSEVAKESQASSGELPFEAGLDPIDKLIELVEEITLQALAEMLPVPVIYLRCEQDSIEETFVKVLIQGTVRACTTHLAQCASEVKDFAPQFTLRRLGLDQDDNAILQAVATELQPIFELIREAPDAADAGPRHYCRVQAQRRAYFETSQCNLCRSLPCTRKHRETDTGTRRKETYPR